MSVEKDRERGKKKKKEKEKHLMPIITQYATQNIK